MNDDEKDQRINVVLGFLEDMGFSGYCAVIVTALNAAREEGQQDFLNGNRSMKTALDQEFERGREEGRREGRAKQGGDLIG